MWVSLSEVRVSCILCITRGQLGLWVALSEVLASCILCITGGQLGLWVGLSEVRTSCTLSITGGQLGLWVGISVITICELVDLVAKLLAYVFTQSKQPVNTKMTQQLSSNAFGANELPRKDHSTEADKYGTVWGSIYQTNNPDVH